MNKTKRTKQEKGITLVALIITIIVLLILAVVAIRAVQGDGIIGHAKNAQSGYEQAQANEQTTLDGYLSKIEENINGENGNGGNGNSGIETLEEVTLADAQSDTMLSRTKSAKVLDASGSPIVVPAGFKILVDSTTGYTSTNVSVTQGIVITDGTSEFVWIPVTDLNKFARVTSGTDANGRTNYRGVLYYWTDGLGYTEYTGSDFGEPANVGYDSTSNMTSWTETLFQESFNKMVESVAKYKGFYVGRYETSLNGTTAQSKSGEPPMNNINWYEMYENSKTYSSSNTNLGVESEMIWGCQWDAMLNFILTTSDDSHVGTSGNVSHNLSSTYYTGGTNYTGTAPYNDKAANIYDIEGNIYDWTQEAINDYRRILRGGAYSASYYPTNRYYHFYVDSTYSGSLYGYRLSLYIK